MLVFEERGKPGYLEKNLRSKDENEQQTQPTYDAESGNQTCATLVRGECSHHCSHKESGVLEFYVHKFLRESLEHVPQENLR